MPSPGRNEPCPCGSGKKFKHCCALISVSARPLACVTPEARIGREPSLHSPILPAERKARIGQHVSAAWEAIQAGAYDAADLNCDLALELQASHSDALHLKGVIAFHTGRHDAAEHYFREAILRDRKQPNFHNSLGNLYREVSKFEQAVTSFRAALKLNPQFAEAHYNLGIAYKAQGKLGESQESYRRAVRLRPDFANARFNLALQQLAEGDFERGWEEYEWRWQVENFPSPRRPFRQPVWLGEDTCGQTILLHAEQGLGDTLQFVRYTPLVAAQGAIVIIECPASLARLLEASFPNATVVVEGSSLPPFDWHCPLLSLPLAFRTTLDSIPSRVPYLNTDPAADRFWRERLAADPPGFRVGLTWAGNRTFRDDASRSLPPELLSPLVQVPGTVFYSLQKDAGVSPLELGLLDYTAELHDFADTAALIRNLDLIVSVDTAVAHLAGALDKAVWTLLPANSDFRWLLERQDSLWYPSMRLFRQRSGGNWLEVIDSVRNALAGRISNG